MPFRFTLISLLSLALSVSYAQTTQTASAYLDNLPEELKFSPSLFEPLANTTPAEQDRILRKQIIAGVLEAAGGAYILKKTIVMVTGGSSKQLIAARENLDNAYKMPILNQNAMAEDLRKRGFSSDDIAKLKDLFATPSREWEKAFSPVELTNIRQAMYENERMGTLQKQRAVAKAASELAEREKVELRRIVRNSRSSTFGHFANTAGSLFKAVTVSAGVITGTVLLVDAGERVYVYSELKRDPGNFPLLKILHEKLTEAGEN